AAMSNGTAPDKVNLANDDVLGTIDSFGLPGNWMIRADGQTFVPCVPTPTITRPPTPVRRVVGHVQWEGSSQPDPKQQQPITLTLKNASGTFERNFPQVTTDASGYFTVPLGSSFIFPPGTYNWRVKGPNGGAPTYPSNPN